MIFKRLRLAAVTASMLALGACSAAPQAAPQVRKPFTWGYTARAQQALAAKFGKAHLKAGDFVWTKKKLPKGATEVVVSLPRQMAYVYHAGDLVAASSVSTGKAGKETPPGQFPIMEKRRHHNSNKYSNAPMPFMQRMTIYGVALHGGDLPGYPASHGCIRLPMKFAEKLYALTDLGDTVYVEE